MKKIGLLIIATNKYINFLNKLLVSANKHFCLDHEVTYFIFTNQKIELNIERSYKVVQIEHKPWPWMTLGRYEIFNNAKEELSKMDYLFYTDVDMEFVGDVGSEILGDRVATQHPGYVGRRGTPETNPESTACIYDSESMTYFAGGFNGGTSSEYLKMCNELTNNINTDYSKGIIAIWHDESHINRYFINNKPTITLNPSYCYPENSNYPQYSPIWNLPRKLVSLEKNNNELKV
jgi:histo-blood group ABO system transferase